MTTKDYKNAVWEFLLEHCDITPNGAVFVKFHCDDRENFEKRVMARSRGYHREDVVAKQDFLVQKKIDHIKQKNEKRNKYKWKKKVRTIKRKIMNFIRL